jgi:hypothetical protein
MINGNQPLIKISNFHNGRLFIDKDQGFKSYLQEIKLVVTLAIKLFDKYYQCEQQ